MQRSGQALRAELCARVPCGGAPQARAGGPGRAGSGALPCAGRLRVAVTPAISTESGVAAAEAARLTRARLCSPRGALIPATDSASSLSINFRYVS